MTPLRNFLFSGITPAKCVLKNLCTVVLTTPKRSAISFWVTPAFLIVAISLIFSCNRGNAVLAILLTILGQKLNVDIYLAAIVVFVGRMFTNLAIIRRYYIDIVVKKIEEKKEKNKRTEENSDNIQQ